MAVGIPNAAEGTARLAREPRRVATQELHKAEPLRAARRLFRCPRSLAVDHHLPHIRPTRQALGRFGAVDVRQRARTASRLPRLRGRARRLIDRLADLRDGGLHALVGIVGQLAQPGPQILHVAPAQDVGRLPDGLDRAPQIRRHAAGHRAPIPPLDVVHGRAHPIDRDPRLPRGVDIVVEPVDLRPGEIVLLTQRRADGRARDLRRLALRQCAAACGNGPLARRFLPRQSHRPLVHHRADTIDRLRRATDRARRLVDRRPVRYRLDGLDGADRPPTRLIARGIDRRELRAALGRAAQRPLKRKHALVARHLSRRRANARNGLGFPRQPRGQVLRVARRAEQRAAHHPPPPALAQRRHERARAGQRSPSRGRTSSARYATGQRRTQISDVPTAGLARRRARGARGQRPRNLRAGLLGKHAARVAHHRRTRLGPARHHARAHADTGANHLALNAALHALGGVLGLGQPHQVRSTAREIRGRAKRLLPQRQAQQADRRRSRVVGHARDGHARALDDVAHPEPQPPTHLLRKGPLRASRRRGRELIPLRRSRVRRLGHHCGSHHRELIPGIAPGLPPTARRASHYSPPAMRACTRLTMPTWVCLSPPATRLEVLTRPPASRCP